MTDETEVLRIKREALEGLRDWTRSRVETVRDVTQYLREVLPPHAPRKVPAEIRWVPDGFCRAQGAHSQWEIGYGERSFGVPKHLFARIADLVARADEQGMVEEGLGGASRPNGESGDRVAPNNPMTPAPAPAHELRAALDAMRDTALVRQGQIKHLRSQLDAMREARDAFEGYYQAAERHVEILRENVDRHGATIRDLSAQLAAATGPVSRETFYRVLEAIALEYGAMRRHELPVNARIARAAITALGRSVEGS